MGWCVYCGGAVGWFRNRHPACAAAARQRPEKQGLAPERAEEELRKLRLALTVSLGAAIARGGDLAAEEGRISEAIAQARLTEAERETIVLAAWKKALAALLEDRLLDVGEERRLAVARERFALSDAELDKDGSLTRLAKAALLRRVLAGEPVGDAGGTEAPPLHLQRDERPVWQFSGCHYLEDAQRRPDPGRARGGYCRPGAFVVGEPVGSAGRELLDSGLLQLTDRGLYFQGPRRTVRIPYTKTLAFIPFADGFGIVRETASARPQVFGVGDGWFAYNLVVHLAKA